MSLKSRPLRIAAALLAIATTLFGYGAGVTFAASTEGWLRGTADDVPPGWSANMTTGGITLTDTYFVSQLGGTSYWGETVANTSSAIDEIYVISEGTEYCYPTAPQSDWYDWSWRYNVVSAVADGTGGYSTGCLLGQSISEWSEWEYTESVPFIDVDSLGIDCITIRPWVYGGAPSPCGNNSSGHAHWW